MDKVIGIILAAGHGTRMKSDLLKVMHIVGGKPMVEHVYENARAAGLGRVIAVVGFQADRVQGCLGGRVEYVVQAEQLGTGHAVMQAEGLLADASGHLLVLYGDNPLLTPEIIQRFLGVHFEKGAPATILTARVSDPTGYGRVVRKPDGTLERIVEEKDAGPDERAIKEIMSGVFCFRLPDIFEALRELRPDNAQKEYYLTQVVEIFQARGQRVEVADVADEESVLAPNTRRQLAQAEAIMRRGVIDRLMDSGVTVIDPQTTYVHEAAVIGRDTTILPFTYIEGATVIGSGCIIGPNSRIAESKIDDDVRIQYSVVEYSEVGSGTSIGPFAHLRAKSRLGKKVEIGNYAEVKNSSIGDGTKAHHHSYLGDSSIGDGVNIGAGVVIVNYDGIRKHQTQIDSKAFIGCNANLIAPVKVGEGAYVAAGSTINKEVPPEALAIARARQENKEGYAKRFRGPKQG